MIEIPEYTKADYTDSTAPYEFVYSFHEDRFIMSGVLESVAADALSKTVRGFKTRYKEYYKARQTRATVYNVLNTTKFTGQPLELDCGAWECDDNGVTVRAKQGEIIVCEHPIMPIERLVNVDTRMVKTKIAFLRGGRWQTVIVAKSILSDPATLAKLSDHGISVNKKSAAHLSDYFKEIESMNYDVIPERRSVTRLGWISDSKEFSPYTPGLEFDGDERFRKLFEMIKPVGNYDEWLEMCKTIRVMSITARIVLATSFASCLIKPLGAQSFFLHLWGPSGTGKTSAQMLAASVWGNPPIGEYIQNSDSTGAGKEVTTAFLNSLPLILDDFTPAKTKDGSDSEIYKLSAGMGRTRANKDGGLRDTAKWNNCVISSAEMPLTNTSSAGGAINRIIEIECNSEIIPNPSAAAKMLRKNYGHAGKAFIDAFLENNGEEKAQALYQKFYDAFMESDTTEKQAMTAAVIMTGDALATEWIFKDGKNLKVSQMAICLQTKAAVDVNARAYNFTCNWIAQNQSKFSGAARDECWGFFENDSAIILAKVFRQVLEDAGFSSAAFLSWLKANNLIQTRKDGRGYVIGRRVNKILSDCIAMQLPQGFEDLPVEFETPFD